MMVNVAGVRESKIMLLQAVSKGRSARMRYFFISLGLKSVTNIVFF